MKNIKQRLIVGTVWILIIGAACLTYYPIANFIYDNSFVDHKSYTEMVKADQIEPYYPSHFQLIQWKELNEETIPGAKGIRRALSTARTAVNSSKFKALLQTSVNPNIYVLVPKDIHYGFMPITSILTSKDTSLVYHTTSYAYPRVWMSQGILESKDGVLQVEWLYERDPFKGIVALILLLMLVYSVFDLLAFKLTRWIEGRFEKEVTKNVWNIDET